MVINSCGDEWKGSNNGGWEAGSSWRDHRQRDRRERKRSPAEYREWDRRRKVSECEGEKCGSGGRVGGKDGKAMLTAMEADTKDEKAKGFGDKVAQLANRLEEKRWVAEEHEENIGNVMQRFMDAER